MFQIGYLGSNAQKDDLKTLLEAFSQLKKEIPQAELNLYGSNLDKSIATEKCVKVHGFLNRSSIQQTLKTNDVLVAIRNKHDYSDYGFPSKLTEYFASKQPIIASRSSDIPHLFKHKERLYLIDPESPNQLCEALIWCALNKSEACAMGQRGYQWARQNWDSELVLKSWYQACLGHVK
jgi:glycosyltransferase involved in cell wall biosynthesis